MLLPEHTQEAPLTAHVEHVCILYTCMYLCKYALYFIIQAHVILYSCICIHLPRILYYCIDPFLLVSNSARSSLKMHRDSEHSSLLFLPPSLKSNCRVLYSQCDTVNLESISMFPHGLPHHSAHTQILSPLCCTNGQTGLSYIFASLSIPQFSVVP